MRGLSDLLMQQSYSTCQGAGLSSKRTGVHSILYGILAVGRDCYAVLDKVLVSTGSRAGGIVPRPDQREVLA
jgi:hypothetical protein